MFSKFVQFWSRRWTSAGVAVDRRRECDVMVAEAVIACDGGATINEVAEGSASTNRGPAGFAVAYRVLGGVSEAEDIVQAVSG